jgi:hypothetical protein
MIGMMARYSGLNSNRRVNMKSRRSKWVSGIGAVGLAVGCLALAGFG